MEKAIDKFAKQFPAADYQWDIACIDKNDKSMFQRFFQSTGYEWRVAEIDAVGIDEPLMRLASTLKEKLPDIEFKYESRSGLWITEDVENINLLHGKFNYSLTDYLSNWRSFLGVSDLIVLGHDCEAWFGFTK